MNIQNDVADGLRHAQHGNFRRIFFGRQRNRVGDDELTDVGVVNFFDGVFAQDGVGARGDNFFRAEFFESFGSFAIKISGDCSPPEKF